MTRASRPRRPEREGPGASRIYLGSGVVAVVLLALLFASLVPDTSAVPSRVTTTSPKVGAPPAVAPAPAGSISAAPCTVPSSGEAIYQAALRWVVQLDTEKPGARGIGSGFVVADRWLATNEHVVSGAVRVTARFADGTTAGATVEWADATEDLALLHLGGATAASVQPAPLAGWSTLAPGKDVYVLGAPLGLDWSVSRGVISALRTSEIEARPHIQIDAAVNPGNSGGPLIDGCGRVVGVVRMKLLSDGSGSGPQAEQLNFARPVDALVPGMRKTGLIP